MGPPGKPAAPTITDQKTPGDSGAVTLTWPKVDPNGPTPVEYTVRRNGTPLPSCTAITATRCDNAGMAYDGTKYEYVVHATNKGGEGRTTPGATATWSAVGRPEKWGSWSVGPTGQDAQGTATFTVPASRGGQSRVRMYVGDSVVKEMDARGRRTETFGVPTNDGPYPVFLEVCNEADACERSSTQTVQTYGPLRDEHIISARSSARRVGQDQYEVWWTITVDTNGDPASVRLTGSGGGGLPQRDETLQFNGVDVQSQTTDRIRIDAEHSEILRVTISDPSPARGSGSRSYRYNAPPRETPVVQISQGSRCNDRPGSGAPACNRSGSGMDCLHASCARIKFVTSGFYQDTARCDMYDSVDGQYVSRTIRTNGTDEPGLYYGYPGRTIYAVCNGERSNTYRWPDS